MLTRMCGARRAGAHPGAGGAAGPLPDGTPATGRTVTLHGASSAQFEGGLSSDLACHLTCPLVCHYGVAVAVRRRPECVRRSSNNRRVLSSLSYGSWEVLDSSSRPPSGRTHYIRPPTERA